MDSPNTSPDGDWEIDGYANLGAGKYFLFTPCLILIGGEVEVLTVPIQRTTGAMLV